MSDELRQKIIRVLVSSRYDDQSECVAEVMEPHADTNHNARHERRIAFEQADRILEHFPQITNTRHTPEAVKGVVEAGLAWQESRAAIAHTASIDIGAPEYDRIINARKRFDAALKAYKIHIGE